MWPFRKQARNSSILPPPFTRAPAGFQIPMPKTNPSIGRQRFVREVSPSIFAALCVRVDGSLPAANIETAIDLSEKLFDAIVQREKQAPTKAPAQAPQPIGDAGKYLSGRYGVYRQDKP